jgi:hypothetical protein
MNSENLGLEIKDLVDKVASDKFRAENLKININKLITAKDFNQLKEQIKFYSEYYRIHSRYYKSDRILYLYYKFFFKNNQMITITLIHEFESPFMFMKYIKVKTINKGD